MKTHYILICLLSTTISLPAQDISVLERDINPGAVVEELKLPPPKTEGNYYFDENWTNGSIILSSGIMISNTPVRIDLKQNHVEIKVNDQIKVCSNTLIDSLYLHNKSTVFINCNNYLQKQCNNQLLEVLLMSDEFHLLRKLFVFTKKPTYVEAIDMGNRNAKLIIKEEFYIYQNNELLKINPARKKNTAIFSQFDEKVINFSKKKGLKFNNSADLKKIFTYYSSIKKG